MKGENPRFSVEIFVDFELNLRYQRPILESWALYKMLR